MAVSMNDSSLIEYIRQSVPSLIALYRFGSQAKGTARRDSDVDLAVLAHDPIPNLRRFELAQELAIQLHRDVDLVDLRNASTVMRMQVLSTGTCLDTQNESARREFEMYAYSDYARLNEERREILKGIPERGLIYDYDVILNKAATIERCLQRILEEYAGDNQNLVANQTKQDAIILNLQRACETAIDLAMYVVNQRRLGVPQESRDAFTLLQTAGILPADLATRMQHMVGFRNVAVHEYTRLNLDVVQAIITKQLDDFRTFSSTMVKAFP